MEPLALLLSDDLIFTSRITAEARAQGVTVKVARSVPALEAQARELMPAGILLDLALAGPVIGQLVPRLREGRAAGPRLVAYGSHVDTATLRSARDAGCDLVLPRSKFVEDLPHHLTAWLAG
jgi:ActR/RegA family two-component response regulator